MKANRRQISIKQILIVTGLLGVIFALAGPGKLPISETLLLVTSLGVAIGLWQQGNDISRALRAGGGPTDSRLERVWKFEKRWRYVLSSLVLIGWVVAGLFAQGILGSTNLEHGDFFRDSPSTYSDGLVLLVIVVGLANPVVRLRTAPRTSFAAWVHRAGWIAGITLLVIVTLRDVALIDALIHMAIRGIELAQPEPYGETFFVGGVRQYAINVSRFAWVQFALVGSAFINVAMLIHMSHRGAKRWAFVGYVVSIAVALGIVLWNRGFGFASISPVQASVQAFWVASVWRPAIPLMVLFGFAATYRLLSEPVLPLGDGPNWRPPGKIYMSESWWVIAVAAIGPVWHSLTDVYYFSSLFGSSFSAFLAALGIFGSPAQYLHLAVVAACVQLTIVRLCGRPLAGQVPMNLNLNRFASTWMAVSVTTYVTLETAVGSSFVYWVVPWKYSPLF